MPLFLLSASVYVYVYVCVLVLLRRLTDQGCRQHCRQHQRTTVRRVEDFSEHWSCWQRKSSHS